MGHLFFEDVRAGHLAFRRVFAPRRLNVTGFEYLF